VDSAPTVSSSKIAFVGFRRRRLWLRILHHCCHVRFAFEFATSHFVTAIFCAHRCQRMLQSTRFMASYRGALRTVLPGLWHRIEEHCGLFYPVYGIVSRSTADCFTRFMASYRGALRTVLPGLWHRIEEHCGFSFTLAISSETEYAEPVYYMPYVGLHST